MLFRSDRKCKVLGWVKISSGDADGTVVDPKVIFTIALQCNAHAIILAHNHPSGDPRPSTADIKLTRKLKQAGKLLQVQITDHIIINSDNDYFSFADEGIL